MLTILKNIVGIIVVGTIVLLSACSSNAGDYIDLKTLSPPVIISVHTDSIVMVKDNTNNEYVLTNVQRIDYRTAFYSVGDTIIK